jgi:hypothetical protein
MKKYIVAGKIFTSLDEALNYASFIHKVSRIIVAVEELK